MHFPSWASVAIAAVASRLDCHPTPLPSNAPSIPSTPQQTYTAPSSSITNTIGPNTPLPTEPLVNLDLREVVSAAAATPAASQYPTLTTEWVETTIGGTPTWVPLVYTQTFPSTYEVWPTAAAGSIGLGTISGSAGAVRTTEPKWSGADSRRVMLRAAVIGVIGVIGVVVALFAV